MHSSDSRSSQATSLLRRVAVSIACGVTRGCGYLRRLLFIALGLLATTLCGNAGAKPFTFVAVHDGSRVAVYDHATSAWVGSVNVGAAPIGIAADAQQRLIAVSNYLGNTVSLVNIASRALVGTVAVGAQPLGVVAPAGRTLVYVANFGAGTVSVIDLATQTVTQTVNVGNQPSGLASSASGDRVFVANTADNSVSVIATASNTVVSTITSVPSRPYALAWVSNGVSSRLMIASNNHASVSVLDGDTYAVLATLNTGPNPTSLAAVSATQVYVTHSFDGTVRAIDPFTLTVSPPLALGTRNFSVATAPGVGFASLVAYPDQLQMINTASNTAGALTTVPAGSNAPLTLGAFVVNPAYVCALDLNGDGVYDAVDGTVIVRYLAGLRGSALINGLPSMNLTAVSALLAALDLDADGVGGTNATSDGLLLERAARGAIGPGLISNARNQALPGVRNSTQVLDWIVTTHGVNCLP